MPGEPGVGDQRRPIAARRWPPAIRAARWLAARGISPNAVSIAGLVVGIAAGVALWLTSVTDGAALRAAWLVAAIAVPLRLLANMLDGMVALEQKRASRVGELYNEVPDRFSDAAALIGLGYAAGGDPTLGFLGACGALLVAYIRTMGAAAGAGHEFCGPMAKPQRMLVVTIIALYGSIAPAAWQPDVGEAGWGLAAWGLVLIIAGCLWTVGRRLRRMARTLREAKP